jgi:hypothetical protein
MLLQNITAVFTFVIQSDNISYEPREITIRSDNNFYKPRAITMKSDNYEKQ